MNSEDVQSMGPAVCPSARFPQPRRVATEPAPFQPPRRSLSVSSAASRSSPLPSKGPSVDAIETLYNHPSVKLIAFTATQGTASAGSQFHAEPKPGSLRPFSQLERTIAVGPFRIYRAPGSVAFLSCGSALQPILPKSQCWCIDETNGRFVLQIRRPQYWRLEVPLDGPDHVHRALVLRDVLDNILLFEKTECPFERSFTVKLPERPGTPVKKKPWTPVGKNLISSPFISDLSPAPPAVSISNEKRRRNTSLREMRPFAEAPVDQIVEKASLSHISLAGLPLPSPRQEGPVQRPESSLTAPWIEQNAPSKNDDVHAGVPEAQQQAKRQAQNLVGKDKTPNPSVQPTLKEPVVESEQALQPCIEKLHGPVDSASPTFSVGKKSRVPAVAPAFTDLMSPLTPGSAALGSLPCQESPGPVSGVALFDPEIQSITRVQVHATSTWASQSSTSHPCDSRQSKVLVESPAIKDDVAEDGELLGITDNDGVSFEGAGSMTAVSLKKKRMSRLLAGRSATLPPQLSLVTSPPSKTDEASPSQHAATLPPSQSIRLFDEESDPASPSGSVDSFHSVQSWHSPITPVPLSPPSSSPSPAVFSNPHENRAGPCKEQYSHASVELAPMGDMTLVPNSAAASVQALHIAPLASQVPLDESRVEAVGKAQKSDANTQSLATSNDADILRRPKNANLSISRRALSPLPPAANLFSPTARQRPPGRMAAVRQLPSAIIHKTVEILLSPPSHLVNLMLQVAAKIVAGEWRGMVFGLGEGGESIPVHWDYSDGELSAWEDDDDYTLSIGRYRPQGLSTDALSNDADSQSSKSGKSLGGGGGDEID